LFFTALFYIMTNVPIKIWAYHNDIQLVENFSRVMSGNPDTLTAFRSFLIPVCGVVKSNIEFYRLHDLPPFSYRAFSSTFASKPYIKLKITMITVV